jgi:hypothetical protein
VHAPLPQSSLQSALAMGTSVLASLLGVLLLLSIVSLVAAGSPSRQLLQAATCHIVAYQVVCTISGEPPMWTCPTCKPTYKLSTDQRTCGMSPNSCPQPECIYDSDRLFEVIDCLKQALGCVRPTVCPVQYADHACTTFDAARKRAFLSSMLGI